MTENPFRYSGCYNDFESKLYYLKARYYSPKLERFISRDTYNLSNRYAYCDGDPILNADPNGHLPIIAQLGLAALAVVWTGLNAYLGYQAINIDIEHIKSGKDILGSFIDIAWNASAFLSIGGEVAAAAYGKRLIFSRNIEENAVARIPERTVQPPPRTVVPAAAAIATFPTLPRGFKYPELFTREWKPFQLKVLERSETNEPTLRLTCHCVNPDEEMSQHSFCFEQEFQICSTSGCTSESLYSLKQDISIKYLKEFRDDPEGKTAIILKGLYETDNPEALVGEFPTFRKLLLGYPDSFFENRHYYHSR